MTFTEAALEVLRSAGEPLHYKKITELAIEKNLLSHVGKTPEVTMSSRLAMMVKKDRGQAPIIKVKPGVFAIRESALEGQGLSAEALAAISEVENGDEVGATIELIATEEIKTVAPALPGGDVFPEEEGDDDPILAGLEQEGDASERAGRRRRRRRRRGKGDKVDGPNEAPLRSEAPREPAREVAREREPTRETSRDTGREGREPNRESNRERDQRRDAGRDRSRDNFREASRDAGRDQHREEAALDWNRQPADGDLLGRDLADAIWMVLSRGDRAPHSFARVAELLVRRGRLSGNTTALAPTIAAAARADVARAELARARPRFRVRSGRISLSEWLLPKPLARAEQDLTSIAERYANELRRALIQKLSELPTAGFAELLATWLNSEGVTALRAVRRPGSSGSELHFAGTRKSGSEEVRLAIVVQRGGRDIDREAVIDVRGALHHYGQASHAWIVTTGRVTSGAREEAAMPAAATALFDGMALAAAMERLGIAVKRHVIPHHEIDYDLLEALGDTPEQRERREREQDRERREFVQRSDRQVASPSREDESATARLRGLAEPRPSIEPSNEVSLETSDDDGDDDAETLVSIKAHATAWEEEANDEDEAALEGASRSPDDEEDEGESLAEELDAQAPVGDEDEDDDDDDDDDEEDDDDDDDADEDESSDDDGEDEPAGDDVEGEGEGREGNVSEEGGFDDERNGSIENDTRIPERKRF